MTTIVVICHLVRLPAMLVVSVHEWSYFVINSCLHLWAVVFSHGQLFSYRGGHLCSWVAVCVHRQLFGFVGNCFY